MVDQEKETAVRDPEVLETAIGTQTLGSYILAVRPNTRGVPEIMADRILLFIWSAGTLQP